MGLQCGSIRAPHHDVLPTYMGTTVWFLARRPATASAKEGAAHYTLVPGDNHIDLTYCPPDLWSSQAAAKWKLLVPRVEEPDGGLRWFVEGHDKSMWNGIGPGFLKHQPGVFSHIDEMKDYGFEWNYSPGALPESVRRKITCDNMIKLYHCSEGHMTVRSYGM
jgi:hypothetical protein